MYFSGLDRVMGVGEDDERGKVPFSSLHINGPLRSPGFSTVDVDLEHQAEQVFVSQFYCKVTFFFLFVLSLLSSGGKSP